LYIIVDVKYENVALFVLKTRLKEVGED